MYNEAQKARFLETEKLAPSQKMFATMLFNKTEEYESKTNTDLSAMKVEDVISMLGEIACMKSHSNMVFIRIIKKYINWCMNEKVPNINYYIGTIDINSLDVSSIKNRTVSSPLHLQQVLNTIFAPEDKKSVDNVFRLACWLLYGGIVPDELGNITVNNVDLTHMTIKYNGYEVPIYRESVPSLLNCINLNGFVYLHPNYPENFIKSRSVGDQLLRGYAPFSLRILQNKLSAGRARDSESDQIPVKLSPERIWLSGLFYTTRENEVLGFKPDFRMAAVLTYTGLNKNIPESKKMQSLAEKRHAYMLDYKRWKEAYKYQ